MPRKYVSLQERIICNSVLSQEESYNGTPCWIWLGAVVVNRSGCKYGRMGVWVPGTGRKAVLVHRLVLLVFRGIELLATEVAMHLCNNTICCNPMHVEGGSQSDNMNQCAAEGRHPSQVTNG